LLLAVFASLYAAGAAAPEASPAPDASATFDVSAAADASSAIDATTSADEARAVSKVLSQSDVVSPVDGTAGELSAGTPGDTIAADDGDGFAGTVVATNLPGPDAIEAADAEPAAGVDPLVEALGTFAAGTGLLPGLEVLSSARGVVISLPEAGSFPPGSAELSPRATEALAALAAELRALPNLVRVEGHTDDVPISTARYASNWELSAARAMRVVELLIAHGLAPERLGAAGYAEHRPRLPNVDAASRARNRRVDIVVLAPEQARTEDPWETLP